MSIPDAVVLVALIGAGVALIVTGNGMWIIGLIVLAWMVLDL